VHPAATLLPVIHQRCVYTCYHVLIRLPEHPALMAVALRKYRSTRWAERSASERSCDARNPRTQVLCTKLTKPPKPQCGAEQAEQRLRGATRGPKYQVGPLYKRSNGTHHRKGCPRHKRLARSVRAPGRHPGLSRHAWANQSAPAAPMALSRTSDLSWPLSHALGQSRLAPPVYPKAFHPVT
jgi:hypothetical protein